MFALLECIPVVQVRECATALLQVAKRERIPIFLVGHVTKSGDIAGAPGASCAAVLRWWWRSRHEEASSVCEDCMALAFQVLLFHNSVSQLVPTSPALQAPVF